MSATSFRTRTARAVMSSRLPMGWPRQRACRACGEVFYCTIDGLREASRSSTYTLSAGAMPVSEPLPHFVDDLLGYLHEIHPTYATLDGVHTHDDLLEDLSRQGVEHEARALSGYLRRLDEIDAGGLTPIEALEHRMLS